MNVNDEIIKAFEPFPPDTFLTVAEIARRCDASQSAIVARLFPPKPLGIRGVKPALSRKNNVRGALKL